MEGLLKDNIQSLSKEQRAARNWGVEPIPSVVREAAAVEGEQAPPPSQRQRRKARRPEKTEESEDKNKSPPLLCLCHGHDFGIPRSTSNPRDPCPMPDDPSYRAYLTAREAGHRFEGDCGELDGAPESPEGAPVGFMTPRGCHPSSADAHELPWVTEAQRELLSVILRVPTEPAGCYPKGFVIQYLTDNIGPTVPDPTGCYRKHLVLQYLTENVSLGVPVEDLDWRDRERIFDGLHAEKLPGLDAFGRKVAESKGKPFPLPSDEPGLQRMVRKNYGDEFVDGLKPPDELFEDSFQCQGLDQLRLQHMACQIHYTYGCRFFPHLQAVRHWVEPDNFLEKYGEAALAVIQDVNRDLRLDDTINSIPLFERREGGLMHGPPGICAGQICFTDGNLVTIKDLKKRPEFNGKFARVQGFVQESRRVKVAFDVGFPKNHTFDLKPANLAHLGPRTPVMIVDLKSRADLNGKRGAIGSMGWLKEKQRYSVKLGTEVLSVKSVNLRAPTVTPATTAASIAAGAAAWSNGLSRSEQYEWLANCYQMRCDDDYVWGGGSLHGPYDPEASPSSIGHDFLLFCLLAVRHCVIPPIWDWEAFYRTAGKHVCFAFEKSDAKERWGGENVFAAMTGGRSLRLTAEAVYGNSAQSQDMKGFSETYVEVRREVSEFFCDGPPRRPSGDPGPLATVGRHQAWITFEDVLRERMTQSGMVWDSCEESDDAFDSDSD